MGLVLHGYLFIVILEYRGCELFCNLIKVKFEQNM